MRITHYTESLNEGGIASFLRELAICQSRSDEVEICTVFKNRAVPADIQSSSVKVYSLQHPATFISYIYFPILIYNNIRKSKSEVIHIHCSFVYYIIAIFLLHRKKKFFYTIHSDAFKEKYSSRFEAITWCIKRLCFKNKWVLPITVSSQSEESFYQLYGFHAKIIVNGIHLKVPKESSFLCKYRNLSHTKLFVHAGRISEAKNQLAMCQAFEKILKEGVDAHLIIAGAIQDSSIFHKIEKYFCDRITYVGHRDDIISMFHEADYMLLPSKWEGLPITLLEAMSQSCIPICTSVGGIPSVVKHLYNGILIQTSSVDSIYSAIKLATSLPDTENLLMANNGLETAGAFSIEKTAQQYLTYYRNAR